MLERTCGGGGCLPHGGEGRKQETERKVWGQGIPFKGTSSVTYFLQVGPNFYSFHHFPNVHSVLTISMDQSID
jgi:hypothetical protein